MLSGKSFLCTCDKRWSERVKVTREGLCYLICMNTTSALPLCPPQCLPLGFSGSHEITVASAERRGFVLNGTAPVKQKKCNALTGAETRPHCIKFD